MYCDFPKDYGHTTEECCHIAEDIEWVIQQDSMMKVIFF